MHIWFVLFSMTGDEVCTYATMGRILPRSLYRTEVAASYWDINLID